jgi:hypothetical protein
MGRVADARPLDADLDGDADLVVAEFGWHQTGKLVWLENTGLVDGIPTLRPHTIDRRPGSIHVPVVDLNQDAKPDFVALISQEHEVVEAFLNRGGQFERRTIFEARDPSFGSSGLELTDLDQDGDPDLLYTNGDMFDSSIPKPYHGIHWLENTDEFPWRSHRLAVMPGVHRALAGDLDGDGDLDLVAVALLPQSVARDFPRQTFDSVLWLEQTEPGQFIRHPLEQNECRHAACEIGDFDGDGDLDLAVGNFFLGGEERSGNAPIALTVWWNETGNRAQAARADSRPPF